MGHRADLPRVARRFALLCATALALALPGAGLAAECEGDDCQGPAPAPEEIVPGTAIVEGPQNPAVRFPKQRHPKKTPGQQKKRHGKDRQKHTRAGGVR